MMILVGTEQLQTFVEDALHVVGIPRDDSKIAARCLVRANLRGVEGKGIRQLGRAVSMIRAGMISAHPDIRIVGAAESTGLVDADYALGHVAATRAMEIAVQKAKRSGFSVVSVRHTNDFGMAANYAMLALESNCIGMVMTNTTPLVAPWGGTTRMLGTNPICISIPARTKAPIVFDAATSTVSRSEIELYSESSQSIPSTWAFSISGEPTTNTSSALEGVLTPLGGYKGFGLALVIDLLTGTLSGMASGPEVRGNSSTYKSSIGQFFASIDLEAFGDPVPFMRKVDELIEDIKTSPLRDGFQEILLPGEHAHRTEQLRMRTGIPLSTNLWEELTMLAEHLGVEMPHHL